MLLAEGTTLAQGRTGGFTVGVGGELEKKLLTQDGADVDGVALVAGNVDVFEVGGIAQHGAFVVVAVAVGFEVAFDLVVFGALDQAQVDFQGEIKADIALAAAHAGVHQAEAGGALHPHESRLDGEHEVDDGLAICAPVNLLVVVEQLFDPCTGQGLFELDGAGCDLIDQHREIDAIAHDAARCTSVQGAGPFFGSGAGALHCGGGKTNVVVTARHKRSLTAPGGHSSPAVSFAAQRGRQRPWSTSTPLPCFVPTTSGLTCRAGGGP